MENSIVGIKEETVVLPVPSMSTDLVVLARDPQQMEVAQRNLIAWFEKKVEVEKAQLAECEENLAKAKAMKLSPRGWQHQVVIVKGRVVFYEKALTALREGYCIVPEFPVQLFAIRTAAEAPPEGVYESRYSYDVPRDVEAQKLPHGDGEYVDVRPDARRWKEQRPNKEGKNEEIKCVEPTGFREVDFPFKLVKPQIVQQLDEAMRLKLFDEIGVLPSTRRKPDPVLVGRIKRRGANKHSDVVLSFLITWWIDTRSL